MWLEPMQTATAASGPEAMTVEELLELRDQVDAEIRRRLDQAEAEIAKLRAAVDASARRAADLKAVP